MKPLNLDVNLIAVLYDHSFSLTQQDSRSDKEINAGLLAQISILVSLHLKCSAISILPLDILKSSMLVYSYNHM